MLQTIFKSIWLLFCFILFVVGFGGIPDDIRTWGQWINEMGLLTDQNYYRWLFAICGFSLIFISLGAHKRLWGIFKSAPLKIEHEDRNADYYYESPLFIRPQTTEELFDNITTMPSFRLCRISIYNSSETTTIDNISIKLIEIAPVPQELKGKLPLNLQFQHHLPNKLDPLERKFIDVVQLEYDNARPLFNIVNIDIPNRTKFFIDMNNVKKNNDYKIKISATGKNIRSTSKEFCFGIRDKDGEGEKNWLWSV